MLEQAPPSDRFLGKARLDPYYSRLLERGYGASELTAAGFFDDGLPGSVQELPCFDPRMLTTPLMKVRSALEQHLTGAPPATAGEPLVLLTTGGFAPVHEGHLCMMESARAHAKEQGFAVLGGYFSPGHDSYLKWKGRGTEAFDAEIRIALLDEVVSESEWLEVCPWEARHAPVSLNFTDVLERLKQYLAYHLKHPIEVGYVFGSDNGGFFDAFLDRGLAFCVPREGDPQLHSLKERMPRLPVSESARRRLHLVSGSSPSAASSSAVRAGNTAFLPAALRARGPKTQLASGIWPASSQINGQIESAGSTRERPLLALRDDLSYGMSRWTVPEHTEQSFLTPLIRHLKDAFEERVRLLSFRTRLLPTDAPVLSLDVCTPGTANLGLSRKFDVGGNQVRASELIARPGLPPLPEQLAALSAFARNEQAPWLIVDDDSVTGSTERAVRSLLARIKFPVRGFDYLVRRALAQAGYCGEVLDVLDARDFLLGAKDAGLVIELPTGDLARAPYMLPFVNLVFRATVPPAAARALSDALWSLNERWFHTHAPTLTLAQADPGCRKLLRYLGFNPVMPLWQCCRELRGWSAQTEGPAPAAALAA